MDKIIKNILKKLNDNGYDAYIVGGYIRNYLLNINTNDIDICTNALPKDIIKLFNLNNNKQVLYGCVNIKTKKYNIDITTYRKESDYRNHSNFKSEYINDLKKDLKRRDFTCNTLLMDKDSKIYDYYNGINHINNKLLKCVGNIEEKLTNDPLRILRAIRIATLYDFKIDDDILNFITNNKSLIKEISFYRKKEELDKILSNKNSIKGLKLIKDLGLLSYLEIDYEEVKYSNDLLGMYSQINLSDNYPLTKSEKNIINNIKDILKISNINNKTLYKYGLYINMVAGEILGINNKDINKMYKNLPIKSKEDIKISVKSIVKLNNNCYNNINDIYKNIENNILENKLSNKNKDIVKFIRKEKNNE